MPGPNDREVIDHRDKRLARFIREHRDQIRELLDQLDRINGGDYLDGTRDPALPSEVQAFYRAAFDLVGHPAPPAGDKPAN